MAEKKKGIFEEALLDLNKINEALNANTKEILRSVAKEEINGVVKESLNEDDYEEDDVNEPTDDVMAVDSEEGDSEETGEELPAVDTTDDAEMGAPEVGGEEPVDMDMDMSMGDEIDMTAASDDDVIKVYKQLTNDSEIEVVGDEITLNVTEPGEYVIKTGDVSDETEPEMEMPAEPEMADAIDGELEVDMDVDVEPAMDADGDGDVDLDDAGVEAPEGEEDEEEIEDLDENKVVYEIALDEDAESVNESSGKPRTATSDVHMGNDSSAPNTGDIEGQTSPVDKETSGDNLSDTTWDDAANDGPSPHGDHIMNENDEVNEEEETVTELETVEEEDAVEETKYVGGKVKRVATAHTNKKLEGDAYLAESKLQEKYNQVLAESEVLKNKNGEYKQALKKFRTMLAETVVFNTNLTYVTKLMMEHSTTKDEKAEIMARFDNEVSTIKESKMLYKSIDKELSKRTISESVDSKINKGDVTSSTSKQLNESTAYADPSTKRIMDLISRVEKR
jgi:hypothetical protein